MSCTSALSTKAGTRYERLAALVFKALDMQSAVIHDLKLAGEGEGVRHQIDVTIDQAGTKRRILLECKDFDLSGKKVGIGIARDFRSVLEDTGADEGWIVTCVGFTEDAAAYAKSKGIKLLLLRAFEEEDMEGRIKEIHVKMRVVFPTNHTINVALNSAAQSKFEEELRRINGENGVNSFDPVYLVGAGSREQINDVVAAAMNAEIDLEADAHREGESRKFVVMPEGRMIEVAGGPLIPFEGIVGRFDIGVETHTFEVRSKRIAELLLQGFGDRDMIIFGDQLESLTIDSDTGEAVPLKS